MRGDVRCSDPVIGVSTPAPADDALFSTLWGGTREEEIALRRSRSLNALAPYRSEILAGLRALSEADAALARAMDEA